MCGEVSKKDFYRCPNQALEGIPGYLHTFLYSNSAGFVSDVYHEDRLFDCAGHILYNTPANANDVKASLSAERAIPHSLESRLRLIPGTQLLVGLVLHILRFCAKRTRISVYMELKLSKPN